MSSGEINYQPVNKDLTTVLQWSLQNQEGSESAGQYSLRVTSNNHFYLRPISQKNTTETCWVSAVFNTIIRWFMEGLGCCETRTTAEKILELTPSTLSTEINLRMSNFGKEIEKEVQKILESPNTNPTEKLKALYQLVEKQNAQLEQLFSVGKMITSTLLTKRLSNPKNAPTEENGADKNTERQEQLKQSINPLLAQLETMSKTIKTSIEHPLKTYEALLSQNHVAFDDAQLKSVCAEVVTAVQNCQTETAALPLPESNEQYQQQLIDKALAGFAKEASLMSTLITQETSQEMASIAKAVESANVQLQNNSTDSDMGSVKNLLNLQKLLGNIQGHICQLEQQQKTIGLMAPILIAKRFGNDEQQNPEIAAARNVFRENTQGALNQITIALRLLKAFMVNPLKAYTEAVSQGKVEMNEKLMSGVLSMVQDITKSYNSDNSNPELIEAYGVVFTHALMISASEADQETKNSQLEKLRSKEFWAGQYVLNLWDDSQNNAELREDLYNKGSALVISLSALKVGQPTSTPTAEEVETPNTEVPGSPAQSDGTDIEEVRSIDSEKDDSIFDWPQDQVQHEQAQQDTTDSWESSWDNPFDTTGPKSVNVTNLGTDENLAMVTD